MLSYLSSCRSRSLTLSKQSRICLSTVKVSKREKKQQENTSLLIAEAKKSNIAQSPLKIKFLVKLINHSWVPDALAQLKFSPKHRAVDVEKIVRVNILITLFLIIVSLNLLTLKHPLFYDAEGFISS